MRFTKEQLEPLFDVPSKQAAKKLGISNNHLKRMCRRIGIERWPHRKIQSLKRLMSRVGAYRSQIIKEIDRIKKAPNSDVSDNMKTLMSIAYKQHYNNKANESDDSDEAEPVSPVAAMQQDDPASDEGEPIMIPVAAMQQDEWWKSLRFVQSKPARAVRAFPRFPLLSLYADFPTNRLITI